MYSVLVVNGRGCQGLTCGAFSWISPPPAVDPAPTGSKISRQTMTATLTTLAQNGPPKGGMAAGLRHPATPSRCVRRVLRVRVGVGILPLGYLTTVALVAVAVVRGCPRRRQDSRQERLAPVPGDPGSARGLGTLACASASGVVRLLGALLGVPVALALSELGTHVVGKVGVCAGDESFLGAHPRGIERTARRAGRRACG